MAAAPEATLAQRRVAVRFPIEQVGDSTFVFPVRNNRWVAAGQRGQALDPARRDTLVARFRVLAVSRGRATALVTGQTTEVTTDHVAVLERVTAPWYRQWTLWVGLLVGGAAGAALGAR